MQNFKKFGFLRLTSVLMQLFRCFNLSFFVLNWFQLENEFPAIEFEYHDGIPECDEFFTKELKKKRKNASHF